MMRVSEMNKKSTVLSILALTLIVVIAIGGSLAYFKGEDKVTNTFAMGDVEISIDEPGWNEKDGEGLTHGSVKTKDPTVTATAGQSYMRVRMEIVDGEGNLITDAARLKLILDTLYYDTAYGTDEANISAKQLYTETDLKELVKQGKIDKEYNSAAFAFAGNEAKVGGDGAIGAVIPAVRYYNYTANSGIFDAGKTPPDKAVLFSNVVIPANWSNEVFDLNGDTYTATENGGVDVDKVTLNGKGYKIVLMAEAIQSANMKNAAEAFGELNRISGITVK